MASSVFDGWSSLRVFSRPATDVVVCPASTGYLKTSHTSLFLPRGIHRHLNLCSLSEIMTCTTLNLFPVGHELLLMKVNKKSRLRSPKVISELDRHYCDEDLAGQG